MASATPKRSSPARSPSGPGARPYVFTKCGLRSVGSGKVYEVLKTDSILRECEDSLRRLGVEAIDLYLELQR
jgi:aryl-alcohol dehydrogenase-like predicted oxidoreductase